MTDSNPASDPGAAPAPAPTPADSAPPPAAAAEPTAPADSPKPETSPAASTAEPVASAPAGDAATAPTEPGQDEGDGKPKRRRRRRRKKKPAEGESDEASPTEGAAEVAPKSKKKARGKKARGGSSRSGGRDRGGRRKPQSDGHHASSAVRSLSQMAQDLLDIEGVDMLGRPRFMDVQVRIPLDAKRDGGRSASMLVEQILRRVQEVREHDRALVPGSVYCYFSESADAESSRPAEPRHVFDGYTSTGRPQFTDFVTMAIERKDDGIDALLDGQDVVVTHVSLGRVLRTAQLAEFGKSSPVYKILGQVDAGLYPVVNGPHKAAFSFQLLRGSTLEGKPRLRVHSVSAVDLTDLADPSVAEILRRFQQRLDAESLRLAAKESKGTTEEEEEEFVLPLLQELAKRLSGRAKRQGRRTEHAVQRADEGQRPTTKASADAAAADDEHILEDDVEGTIVILGPKGRVHVYSRDGKHVTSFMMTGGNVQKRRQEGRWRASEPAARGEFRIQLRKRLDAGKDAGEPEAKPEDPAPSA